MDFLDITSCLKASLEEQVQKIEEWHNVEPHEESYESDISLQTLRHLIVSQHLRNFTLWHIEDTARRVDVGNDVIAECKRAIDSCNQERNDFIEKVDTCLGALLSPLLPKKAHTSLNTETPGMAIDRLSILALKIFHMREQTLRADVDHAHIATCQKKLELLLSQRASLTVALFELLDDYRAGKKSPGIYYQFKMYNDPSLNPELYKNKA